VRSSLRRRADPLSGSWAMDFRRATCPRVDRQTYLLFYTRRFHLLLMALSDHQASRGLASDWAQFDGNREPGVVDSLANVRHNLVLKPGTHLTDIGRVR